MSTAQTSGSRCPLCNRPNAKVQEVGGGGVVTCPGCGGFIIGHRAAAVLHNDRPPTEKARLSGFARETAEQGGNPPRFQIDDLDSYLANCPAPFDVAVKVRKLLSAIARRTQPGDWHTFSDATDPPLAYAASVSEWGYLTDYAKAQGWVEKNRSLQDDTMQLRLTPAGWEESQRRPRIESAQGFVAMWFDKSMMDAFTNGLKPAIEDDCHYRCRRIDAKEYNGDVVDELMAEIRESRFVVCDLTGHRGGVYFEAGFAMGLGIPTIWTCRKDTADKTHFDAGHFNQIRWTTPDDLRKKLAIRIRATIGLGPLLPAKS